MTDEIRKRRALSLPVELWDWLDAVAKHDQSPWNDHIEGLVLLAMDNAEERLRRR